jgi:ribosomal protein S4
MKPLIKILQEHNLVISLSESRRLVCMGGVKVNGKLCEDLDCEVETGDLIEIGKKKSLIVE